MPFPEQEQHPFTESGIDCLTSPQPGIYGIFNSDCCIDIGQADDLKTKLLRHLRGQSPQSARILQNKPTYYLQMTVAVGLLDTRQAQLITDYNPVAQYG